jgi:hypothetical protein
MPPETQFLLGEMNAKLDTLIRRTEEDRKKMQDEVAKLSARVETLEKWRWMIAGAAGALGGGAGFLVKVLTS